MDEWLDKWIRRGQSLLVFTSLTDQKFVGKEALKSLCSCVHVFSEPAFPILRAAWLALSMCTWALEVKMDTKKANTCAPFMCMHPYVFVPVHMSAQEGMHFLCQTDPELTLLLHVVGSSPLYTGAQKAVRNTIDGTLKSYILICVRWYSLINILSRARMTQNPSLFLPLFFFLLSPVPVIRMCSYVNLCQGELVQSSSCSCTFLHLCVCVCLKKGDRQWKTVTEIEHMCEIGFSHLESAHVSWIPCIFQTVLIALEKEL